MHRILTVLAIGALLIGPAYGLLAQNAPTSAPSQADAAKIQALIRGLGSDEYTVREQSQKDLAAIGVAAMDEIQKATQSDDLEVKQRADQLMAGIAKVEHAAKSDSMKKNYLWGFAMNSGMTERPVVAGNLVLAVGADAKVHALDIKTGKEAWSAGAAAPPSVIKSATAPASKPPTDSSTPVPAARAPAGALPDDEPVLASEPVVCDGMVIYSDGRQIDAASLDGGRPAWSFPGKNLPAAAGGLVFVGSVGGGLTALDIKTGKQVWKTDNAMTTFARPAVGEGVVCIVGTESTNARIAVGTRVQAFDVKNGNQLYSIEIQECRGVYARGGLVIVRSKDAVAALDIKSGNQVWKQAIPFAAGPVSVRLVSGDTIRVGKAGWEANDLLITGEIVCGVRDDEVVAFDIKTGKEIWKTKLTPSAAELEVGGNSPRKVVETREPDAVKRQQQNAAERGAPMQAQMIMAADGQMIPNPVIVGAGVPVVGDGAVYVAAVNGIYAIDIKTGRRLWQFRPAYIPDGKLALVDGVLYFGSGGKMLLAPANPGVKGLNALRVE